MTSNPHGPPPGTEQPTLEVGGGVPAFSLRRTFKETVSLADLLVKGPVVLLFYVFDFGEI